MPSRTRQFQLLPWSGGLNTSLDAGLIPSQQLVQADNIVIDFRQSRKKRTGFEFHDSIAEAEFRESTGTDRTLVLAAAYAGAFSVSDDISVFHHPFDEDYDIISATVTSVTTTTNPNDTITYTHTTSFTESSTATTAFVGLNDSSASIIGLYDYHYSSGSTSKNQILISADDDGVVYKYDSDGIRTPLTNSGTALSSDTDTAFEVVNENLIVGWKSVSNTPKKYNPNASANLQNLGGSPPNFFRSGEHLSRLFTDDKTDLDRIHYSSTGNPEEWNGVGDSGAIDIGIGDGDPTGIVAIFPSFKGDLYVAKRTKLYRISGFTPEEFIVQQISASIGCVSHASVVPVDNDEIYFASDKGFHRLFYDARAGGIRTEFISDDITRTFNTFVNRDFISGAYLPGINSIAWSINEDGDADNQDIWLYNLTSKQWYRWPEISCNKIITRFEEITHRLYIGTNEGRVLKTVDNTYSDFGNQPIELTMKTGVIYPDNQVSTVKGFKKLSFTFKPQPGGTDFTAMFRIDSYPPQELTFELDGSFGILGDTFILGETLLGAEAILAPFTLPVDGYGHGCSIEVVEDDADADLELNGFSIEFEDAGTAQETVVSSDSE